MGKSKYLRRAKDKLAKRIELYEEAVKRDKAGGLGLRKPGSLNKRKAG